MSVSDIISGLEITMDEKGAFVPSGPLCLYYLDEKENIKPRCHMYLLFIIFLLIFLTGVGGICYFLWMTCEAKYLT